MLKDRSGLRWNERAQKVPIYYRFEGWWVMCVCGRDTQNSEEKKCGGDALSTTRWYINQAWMVSCSTSVTDLSQNGSILSRIAIKHHKKYKKVLSTHHVCMRHLSSGWTKLLTYSACAHHLPLQRSTSASIMGLQRGPSPACAHQVVARPSTNRYRGDILQQCCRCERYVQNQVQTLISLTKWLILLRRYRRTNLIKLSE